MSVEEVHHPSQPSSSGGSRDAQMKVALRDMQVLERDTTQAIEVARRLAHDFPDNPELAAFLEVHDASARR